MNKLNRCLLIVLTLQTVPVVAGIEFDSLYLDCGTTLYAFEKTLSSRMHDIRSAEGHFVRAYAETYLGNLQNVEYKNPGKDTARITAREIELKMGYRISRETGDWYHFANKQVSRQKNMCKKSSKASLMRRVDEHNNLVRNNPTRF